MKIRPLVQKTYESTEPYVGVSSIENRLLKHSFLVVENHGNFLGILTAEDIMESAHQLVIDCLHVKPPVDCEQDLEFVLEAMKESRNYVLPVFRGDNFIGVVTRADITYFLIEYNKDLECEIAKRNLKLVNANKNLKKEIEERKRTEDALRESEQHFRSFFEDSPISIWENDWSEVKTYLDNLRGSGVKDFRAYFEKNPKVLARCLSMVKIVDVNRASLKLYGSRSKKELLKGLKPIFCDESYKTFIDQLIIVAEGKTQYESEVINQTLKGEKKPILLKWVVIPGYRENFSRVLVFKLDLTELKTHQLAKNILKQYSTQIISIREEEKKALSLNLHDEAGALAISLNTSLHAVEMEIKENNLQEALRNLRHARDILNSSIVHFRRMAIELLPHNLELVGLPAVLKEYFHGLEKKMGNKIEFRCNFEGKKLNNKVSLALYRVAQESLTNIIKHASANYVRAGLYLKGNSIKFSISDNGRGFDVEKILANTNLQGIGIWGIRERIESLEGEFRLRSIPSKGTKISINLPYKQG